MNPTATLTQTVGEHDTAAGFGAHFPQAASTPFVLGLAEVACHNVVAPTLADGDVTVGVHASIEHRLPSPIGATLTARAELMHAHGGRFSFKVEVYDGEDLCAIVWHRRAVANAARMAERLDGRRVKA
jgi:fluoroacetyl-CoA thioesterase